jgi:hypothetical protein
MKNISSSSLLSLSQSDQPASGGQPGLSPIESIAHQKGREAESPGFFIMGVTGGSLIGPSFSLFVAFDTSPYFSSKNRRQNSPGRVLPLSADKEGNRQ